MSSDPDHITLARGDRIKLVTVTGWKDYVSFIDQDANGVLVKMAKGQKRFYPWSEIKLLAWDGPDADDPEGGDHHEQ